MKDETTANEKKSPSAKEVVKQTKYACSAGDQPSSSHRREMRRASREPDYESRLRVLFGDELRGVKVLPRGAVVYFKDGGQLRDDGDRFTVTQMTEIDASRRLVKSAMDRGWTSATFMGSDQFLREAFRVALDKGLDIHPSDSHQARLLAEVRASLAPASKVEASVSAMSKGLADSSEGFKGRLDALRRSREQMEEQFRRNRAPNS